MHKLDSAVFSLTNKYKEGSKFISILILNRLKKYCILPHPYVHKRQSILGLVYKV